MFRKTSHRSQAGGVTAAGSRRLRRRPPPSPDTLVVEPPQPPPDGSGYGHAPQPVVPRRRSRLRSALRSWPVVLIFAGVVVLGLAFGAAQGYMHDRVPYGVSVAGVDIGGLTRAQARTRLADLARERGVETVQLNTPKGAVIVPLAELGVSVDLEATVARAVRHGRLGVVPGLPLWLGRGGAVEPVVRFDAAAFQQGLEAVRTHVEVPPLDARLALRGETIGVRPGQDGVAVDDVALQRLLIESVTDLQPFAEAVPTRAAAPAVTTSAARAVASDAAVYVSAPLSLRYRGRVVSLGPRQLAAMLSVNEGDDAVAYPLTFDNPQARATLHRMFRFAETPPIDARVELRGKDVVIVPSREGFGLNMDRVLSDMDDAASRSGLRQVVVNLTVWHPTRTTQDVEQLGLSALGSEYATYYDPNNHSRSSNIIQAARLVDGAVIRPGEVFSLNATLGPRTTDRGFDYAPVIVDGVLRMGVGGGVCQFATTLFNAAFFAGLPIVERHPHDFYIEHYPVGRDASVSWGSNDLKFTNDTDHAIMIRCWAKNGELTIVLVGGTGRKVTYTTTQFYDIRPSPYTKSHPRVIYDGDLASGIIKWEHGYSGRTVKVVRTVTKDGRTLYHDTFVSSYAPKDWIKRVGTR